MLTHAFVLQSAFDFFSANLFQPGPDDNMDLLLPLKTNRVRNTAHTCMSCSDEIYPFGPISAVHPRSTCHKVAEVLPGAYVITACPAYGIVLLTQ